MPAPRPLAKAFTETFTAFVPPTARTPLLCERLSQGTVTAPPQLIEPLPVFTSVKDFAAGINGPLTGPLAVNPVPGEMAKSSGTSNDSIIPVVVELAGEVALAPMPRLA